MLLLDRYGEALPLLGAGHPEGLKVELLVSAQCPVDPATALPEGEKICFPKRNCFGKHTNLNNQWEMPQRGKQFAATESERCLLRLTLLLQAGYVSYRNPRTNDGTVLLAGQYPALPTLHPQTIPPI